MFPSANMKEDLNLKPGRRMIGMTHQSKFVTAITAAPTNPLIQRHLLIAIMEANMIRIARVGLDT